MYFFAECSLELSCQKNYNFEHNFLVGKTGEVKFKDNDMEKKRQTDFYFLLT